VCNVLGPDPGFDIGNMQNLSTEELEAMLAKMQGNPTPENEEEAQERLEEQHPDGERLVEDGPPQDDQQKDLDNVIGR